jgi:sulfur carrier protein ThiS
MEITLRATSHLAEFMPASGTLNLNEGSRVKDVLEDLGINSDLVMLVVLDGVLADIDSRLDEGMTVELIPPISGG